MEDNQLFPCASQQHGFETLTEKTDLSSRVLRMAIYLLEQVNQAVEHEQHPDNYNDLRDYLLKCHKVLARYCQVLHLCDRPFQCPFEIRVKLQIVILADECLHLLRTMKRSISIMPQLRTPIAQNVLYKIVKKINMMFQAYYLTIDYWKQELNAAGFFY